MPHNSDILISDTSCLILLSKIDELEFLRHLANKVYITSIIQAVKPILEKIQATNFRLSKEVIKTLLKEAGE